MSGSGFRFQARLTDAAVALPESWIRASWRRRKKQKRWVISNMEIMTPIAVSVPHAPFFEFDFGSHFSE
jgi:hypothetical protein